MHKSSLRVGAVAAIAAWVLLAGGTAAVATPPGPGVSGTVLSQTTVGDTDYTLREITIPAGQSTGWHYKGRTPVVLDVLHVLPPGAPFSEDAPNLGCDFQ
ncbi:hypothetical protein [Dactylosporangium sp. NPDC049140]|uniref:hypothetical protein n=1 Tax=Dactylosporangium sp. NPDC049140 TaxID=3155647 RepID=UPI0033F8EA82